MEARVRRLGWPLVVGEVSGRGVEDVRGMVEALCTQLAAMTDPLQLSEGLSVVLELLKSAKEEQQQQPVSEKHPLTHVFVQRCQQAPAFFATLAAQPPQGLRTLMPVFRVIFNSYLQRGNEAYFQLGEVIVQACCASILAHRGQKADDVLKALVNDLSTMVFDNWHAGPASILSVHNVLVYFSTLSSCSLYLPSISSMALHWLSRLPRTTRLPLAVLQHVHPSTGISQHNLIDIATMATLCHASSLAPVLSLAATYLRHVDSTWATEQHEKEAQRIGALLFLAAAAIRGLAHSDAETQATAAKVVQQGCALAATALPHAVANAERSEQAATTPAASSSPSLPSSLTASAPRGEHAHGRALGSIITSLCCRGEWPSHVLSSRGASKSAVAVTTALTSCALLACHIACEVGAISAGQGAAVVETAAAQLLQGRGMSGKKRAGQQPKGTGGGGGTVRMAAETDDSLHALCACYILKHTSCGQLRLTLCHALPNMCVSTGAAHLVARVATSLANDAATTPLAITVLLDLSNAFIEFRPLLYRSVVDAAVTEGSDALLSHTIARAHAIVQLTAHPQHPPLEVLLPLAHSFLQWKEPSVQAMGMRAIANMCEYDALDARSTFDALKPWLSDHKMIPTIVAAACFLVGAIRHPSFDTLPDEEHKPESTDFVDNKRGDALQWLWERTRHDEEAVRAAAYVNLAKFHPSCLVPLEAEEPTPEGSAYTWAPVDGAAVDRILTDTPRIVSLTTSTSGLLFRALSYELSQVPRSVVVRWRRGEHASVPPGAAASRASAATQKRGRSQRLLCLQKQLVDQAAQSISRHISIAGLLLSPHLYTLASQDQQLAFLTDALRTVRCGEGFDALVLCDVWNHAARTLPRTLSLSEPALSRVAADMVQAVLQRPSPHADANVAAFACALALTRCVPLDWTSLCANLCRCLLFGGSEEQWTHHGGSGGHDGADDATAALDSILASCKHLSKRRSATMRQVAAFFLPLLDPSWDADASMLAPTERVLLYGQTLGRGEAEHSGEALSMLVQACVDIDDDQSIVSGHMLAFAAHTFSHRARAHRASSAADVLQGASTFDGSSPVCRLLLSALGPSGSTCRAPDSTVAGPMSLRALVLDGWAGAVQAVKNACTGKDFDEDQRLAVVVGVHRAQCSDDAASATGSKGAVSILRSLLQQAASTSIAGNAVLTCIALLMDEEDTPQQSRDGESSHAFVPPVLAAVAATMDMASREHARHVASLLARFSDLPPGCAPTV